jgi:hypothetical protein
MTPALIEPYVKAIANDERLNADGMVFGYLMAGANCRRLSGAGRQYSPLQSSTCAPTRFHPQSE